MGFTLGPGKSVTLATLIVAVLALLAVECGAQRATDGVSLEFVDDTTTRTWNGQTAVTFNYTFGYHGEELEDTVAVEVVSKPAGWCHILTATGPSGVESSTGLLGYHLKKGETANLTLFVQPTLGGLAGGYGVKLVTKVHDSSTDGLNHTVTVVIPQEVDFRLEAWRLPEGGIYRALPPASVRVDLAVYNLGNGVDSFHVMASSSRASLGWPVSVAQGLDANWTTPLLDPDPHGRYPHILSLAVTIPPDAIAGEGTWLTVEAISVTDPEEQKPPLMLTVEALQYYAFQASIQGPLEQSVLPGHSVEFPIRLVNLGNGEDTISVTASYDPQYCPNLTLWVVPSRPVLDVGTEVTVTLRVAVPLGAPVGTSPVTVEVRSTDPGVSTVVRTVQVLVAQQHAVELACDLLSVETGPGETFNVNLTLRNMGNGLDSVVVLVSGLPEDWIVYVLPSEATYLPGEMAWFNVTVRVPEDMERALEGSYLMTVGAASAYSEANASMELEVRVRRYWRVEWLSTDGEVVTGPGQPVAAPGSMGPPMLLDLWDGNSSLRFCHLRNLGSGTDNVTVDGVPSTPGLRVVTVPGRTLVARDDELNVSVLVSVVGPLRPGTHTVLLTATSEGSGSVARSVPVEVEVVPPLPANIFRDLEWSDAEGDDYRLRWEGTGEEATSSRGVVGRGPSVDIVGLRGVLDIETSTLTVTLELSATPSLQAGYGYHVLVVRPRHRQPDDLRRPEEHRTRELEWEVGDPGASICHIWLAGGEAGSRPAMASLRVWTEGDRVLVSVSTRDLRACGVEEGEEIGLYAMAVHEEGEDLGAWWHGLTWDSAGVGAAVAPGAFDDMPDEGASLALLAGATGLVVAIAVGTLLLVLRRHRPEAPEEATREEGPIDQEGWREFQ